MRFDRMFLSALVLASLASSAYAGSPRHTTDAPKPTQTTIPQIHEDQPGMDGGHVFQQHCSRCHNAPESFSPRISGTIVRHMRIRAALSQEEEEALLRFFNP